MASSSADPDPLQQKRRMTNKIGRGFTPRTGAGKKLRKSRSPFSIMNAFRAHSFDIAANYAKKDHIEKEELETKQFSPKLKEVAGASGPGRRGTVNNRR